MPTDGQNRIWAVNLGNNKAKERDADMFQIHEANPNEINFLCPKASFGKDSCLALRPFSVCADCPYMSHMNCYGPVSDSAKQKKFAKNAKKGLQTF
jgi:hypothetical protein